MAGSLVSGFAGLALIALCLPRGAIVSHYGTWDRYLRSREEQPGQPISAR